MGTHNNQRMRRAYLKRLNGRMVNGGRQTAKGHSSVDFQSHMNINGRNPTGVLTKERWRYLNRVEDYIDRAISHMESQRFLQRENAHKAILGAIKPLQKFEGEGEIVDKRRITLVKSPRLDMLWSFGQTRYKFIQFEEFCIRESIVYRSRERAYQVFHRKEITWKKVTVTSP